MTKRKTTPRADAATVDRRTTTIMEWILEGKSSRTIVQDAAKHKDLRGLGERSVREYIAKARNEITALGEFDKAHEFGRALARLDRLFAMALEKKDIPAARAVLADRMKMLGIAGPIHIVTDESGAAATSWLEIVRNAATAQEERADATPEDTGDA